mgnify:CR=1 FL=1
MHDRRSATADPRSMIQYKSALALEDDPMIGFALEDMLLEIGFREVHLVTTIAQAHLALERGLPSAAVLDVNIRGERSYAFAMHLVANKIPFVFATGYGDSEHPDELRVIPTITKPYSVSDIRAAIMQATSQNAS